MKPIAKFAFVLALVSCDDTFEFVKRDNQPPQVYFQGVQSANTLTDSLKLGTSIKTGNPFYTLGINVRDLEGAIATVHVRGISGGSAKIIQNQIEVFGAIVVEDGFAQIEIYPDQPGLLTLGFEATDNVGKSVAATFNLFTFDNLDPVGVVTLTATKVTGPYEYEFDASGSYDRDRNFGGEVTAYEYVINDTQTILTSTKIIKHSFPGPGGYRVKYRVHDNEGATSEVVTAPQITIQ